MGRRGRNRDQRELILANLEEHEPEVYAELVELRGRNPQAYRKELRKWVQLYPIPKPQKVIANRAAVWHGRMLTDPQEIVDAPFQIARNAIRFGNVDDRLEEIEALEKAGRDRPVIYQIIGDRRAVLAEGPHGRPDRPGGGEGWGYKAPEE